MEKAYKVYLNGFYEYKTLFGKKEIQTTGYWPYYIMAENEEEAIVKAKERYNKANEDSIYRAYEVMCNPISWDDWTVKEAMQNLNGKQFAEYLRQQNLTKYVKELAQ